MGTKKKSAKRKPIPRIDTPEVQVFPVEPPIPAKPRKAPKGAKNAGNDGKRRARTRAAASEMAPMADHKAEPKLTHQQESFAQLVASGRSQSDAYRAAYPTSQKWPVEALYAQSSALAANSKVLVRIKTLRAVIQQQAIEEAVVDKAWVLKRLKTVAERCLQSAPVLNKKGDPVLIEGANGEIAVAYEFNPMGASRSLELLGKEQGMFVDHKEVGKPGDFTRSREELKESITERGVRLGVVKAFPVKKTA